MESALGYKCSCLLINAQKKKKKKYIMKWLIVGSECQQAPDASCPNRCWFSVINTLLVLSLKIAVSYESVPAFYLDQMSGHTKHWEIIWEESFRKEISFIVEQLNPRSNHFSFSLRSLALEITSFHHCWINIFLTFFADRPTIWALDCGHGLELYI